MKIKKIISLILILIITSSFAVIVSFGETGKNGLVSDAEGYIDSVTLDQINSYINKTYNEYNCSVVIVYRRYVPEDDGERDKEAENYYCNGGFCDNGVILYLGVQSRSFDIYAHHGNSEGLYTYSEGDLLNDGIMPFLSDDEFGQAALEFAKLSYEYAGNNNVESYYFNGLTVDDIITRVIIAFIIALIISLIIVFLMKSKMKTVKPNHSAGDYIMSGSNVITLSQDRFLYSSVSKIKKPENNSSGGHGGSGKGGSHHGGHF